MVLWFVWTGVAHGADQDACLVRGEVTETEVVTGYLNALQIESRKTGTGWHWTAVADGETCPANAPRLDVSEGSVATLTAADHPPLPFQLDTLDPSVRPRSLARSVLAQLDHARPTVTAPPVPLLSQGETITLGVAPTVAPPTTPALGWMLRAGALYAHQSQNMKLRGLTTEWGLLLLDDRAVVSVSGGYAWSQAFDFFDVPTRLSHVEGLLSARGGPNLGAIQLRAGAGLGLRRQQRFEYGTGEVERSEEVERESSSEEEGEEPSEVAAYNAGVVMPQVELVWQVGPQIEISAITGPHLYWGRTVQAAELETRAKTAYSAQLMLGFWR